MKKTIFVFCIVTLFIGTTFAGASVLKTTDDRDVVPTPSNDGDIPGINNFYLPNAKFWDWPRIRQNFIEVECGNDGTVDVIYRITLDFKAIYGKANEIEIKYHGDAFTYEETLTIDLADDLGGRYTYDYTVTYSTPGKQKLYITSIAKNEEESWNDISKTLTAYVDVKRNEIKNDKNTEQPCGETNDPNIRIIEIPAGWLNSDNEVPCGEITVERVSVESGIYPVRIKFLIDADLKENSGETYIAIFKAWVENPSDSTSYGGRTWTAPVLIPSGTTTLLPPIPFYGLVSYSKDKADSTRTVNLKLKIEYYKDWEAHDNDEIDHQWSTEKTITIELGEAKVKTIETRQPFTNDHPLFSLLNRFPLLQQLLKL